MPVALDEGFELLRDLVELFRRYAAREHDLDRLRIVVFLEDSMGSSVAGSRLKA
jgi:hypothetical protein